MARSVSASKSTLLIFVSLWVTRSGSSPRSYRSVRAQARSSTDSSQPISSRAWPALPWGSAAASSFSLAYRFRVSWKSGMV